MRKYTFLLTVVLSLLVLSCSKDDSKTNYDVNLQEAKVLINDWIFNDYNPQMNPSSEFSVIENTTDEIYEKLNGQVFYVALEQSFYGWVFIKNKKVFNMNSGYIHPDDRYINQLIVTDLDNDSEYELFYTSKVGSGILYQNINCFYFSDENSSEIQTKVIGTMPLHYTIYLQKTNYQQLNIFFKDDVFDQKIAEPKFLDSEEGKVLAIEFEENIPQEILDQLQPGF